MWIRLQLLSLVVNFEGDPVSGRIPYSLADLRLGRLALLRYTRNLDA